MLKSRLYFPTETLAIIVTGVRCSLEHALYIKSSDLDIYLTILAKVDNFYSTGFVLCHFVGLQSPQVAIANKGF